MITTAKARDLAGCWHAGEHSALYHFATQGLFQPQKSIRYLWEILQHLQNEYFLKCPRSLTTLQVSQLHSLQLYFENEIRSCTSIQVTYKEHPVYGYLYPDAVSGYEDIVSFEVIELPH